MLIKEFLWVHKQVEVLIHNLILHQIQLQALQRLLYVLESVLVDRLFDLLDALFSLRPYVFNVLHVLAILDPKLRQPLNDFCHLVQLFV